MPGQCSPDPCLPWLIRVQVRGARHVARGGGRQARTRRGPPVRGSPPRRPGMGPARDGVPANQGRGAREPPRQARSCARLRARLTSGGRLGDRVREKRVRGRRRRRGLTSRLHADRPGRLTFGPGRRACRPGQLACGPGRRAGAML